MIVVDNDSLSLSADTDSETESDDELPASTPILASTKRKITDQDFAAVATACPKLACADTPALKKLKV